MNNIDKLNLMKDRYNRMSNSPKNIKCPGVVRKLKRNIANLELKSVNC